MASLLQFFHSDDFLSHGHCFLWDGTILWLHVLSDAGIVFAYYAIPLALIYFTRKRRDLPFKTIFLLFGTFILLCGTTHLLNIWVLWHPDYAAEGLVKAATAIASILTLIVTIRILPSALSLVSADTKALADSEARLRAVVDYTAEGLITIDEQGVIQSFNKACERIFGYGPDEVIGKNVNALMPEPNRSRHDGYLKRYKETGEGHIIGTIGREVEGVKKDGTIFSLELSISEVSISGQRFFSGIVRDITERKQAEQRLARAVTQLTESNTQLERFAYICSHDLQEPLRTISNYTQRLAKHLDNKLDDQSRHYMEYVSDGAHHARDLIADILTYARIGNETQKAEAIDCNIIVKTLLATLEPAITESHAVITHDELPMVMAHTTPVLQLFQNLLSNAIKFHGTTPPRIHIGVKKQASMWEFSIRDNGIGIAPEYQDDIFVIFQRLNRRGEYPGTGMGLAICKKIVEQYEGQIWLESAPGKGTIFFFTLPISANNTHDSMQKIA